MTVDGLEIDFASDRAHYDISDDFFRCCLDPTMSYSCAYFANGDETLEAAQLAKIDRALDALRLEPGQRLLEIGSGWGATARRARERFGVDVVGLTLSLNHYEHSRRLSAGQDGVRFQVGGWETYDQPCDRIVSFGAFEHFTRPKYPAFFARCRALLPTDGLLALQSITLGRPSSSRAFAVHSYFMVTRVFPKAEIPSPEEIVKHGREQGLELVQAECLRPHYARTLECWADNLLRNRSRAIEATDEPTYRMFLRYFASSAKYFRSGEANAYSYLMRAV